MGGGVVLFVAAAARPGVVGHLRRALFLLFDTDVVVVVVTT